LRDFITAPRIPTTFFSKVRELSPTAARFLQYGRYNINTEGYWNKRYLAVDYDDGFYLPLRRELIKLVPPRTMVLDAGCGNGTFIELLKTEKNCNCVGLDISEVAISIVRRKGFEGIKCKLPTLPDTLIANCFDVCTIAETLEHISHPEKAIRALSRLIKVNGYIVVAVPDDCMRPEQFDEHVCSFTFTSLHDVLSKYFTVDVAFRIEHEEQTHLVMRGKKHTNTDL